jgi:hypothetical protein
MRPLIITGEVARKAICQHVLSAPDGYVVRIGDIAEQCHFLGRKRDRETWKRLLIDAYVRVARENAKAEGNPDPFSGQGEVVPSLDGTGVVQLGVQSRGFKVKQASEFIEYLFSFGAERGVVWTDPEAPLEYPGRHDGFNS